MLQSRTKFSKTYFTTTYDVSKLYSLTVSHKLHTATTQNRFNFCYFFFVSIFSGRPNYTNFGASAHQSRVPVHYQQPQVTQIRTERQKHAQEESERMERINRSTATYNRPPNMTFKR